MLFVLLTFILVLAVVLGVYWALEIRPDAREQEDLKRRLRTTTEASKSVRTKIVKEVEKLSSVGPLNAALTRTQGLTGPLKLLIERSGAKVTVGSIVLAMACLLAGVWMLVSWLSRYPWIGLPAGLVAGWIPIIVLRFKASRRITLFEEQFPEAIDLIARALRAGHAFTTGLAMVAEEAPQPVGGEFRALYDQQNFGMPMPEALRAFAERIPLLDSRFFVTAVLTQREAGGNLAEVLDNLGSVIRERFKVKRQIRVLSAHGRITGWVLSAIPPVLAVALLYITPQHMRLLIDDPLGPPMILAAVVLQIMGTLIIRKIVNIEY
jgi:tight adherence protein B